MNTNLETYISEDEEIAAIIWLDELVKKAQREGIQLLIGKLTPALAKVLLSRNPDNRDKTENKIKEYSKDIISGRWCLNGETIVVSLEEGLLNDGQNRCEAVLRTGRTVEIIFVIGVTRDSRSTLNQGKVRTIADYLRMDDYEDARNLASLANFAWQYEKSSPKVISTASSYRATKTELHEFVNQNLSLVSSLEAIPQKNSVIAGGRAVLAFCHWIISKKTTAYEAKEFTDLFVSGAGLEPGSMVLYLRNRILKSNYDKKAYDPHTKIYLVLRAWNGYRRKENEFQINVSKNYLPEIDA